MKFIRILKTLSERIFSLKHDTAFHGYSVYFRRGIINSGITNNLSYSDLCSTIVSLDQSSLQIKETKRSISFKNDRDDHSSSVHGISRIVKGIDLHFIKKFWFSTILELKTSIITGVVRIAYIEEKACLLTKKLYIQTENLHFHNK